MLQVVVNKSMHMPSETKNRTTPHNATMPREKPSQITRDRAQKERIYNSLTTSRKAMSGHATDSIIRQIGQLVPSLKGKKLTPARITMSPSPETVHERDSESSSKSSLGMSDIVSL